MPSRRRDPEPAGPARTRHLAPSSDAAASGTLLAKAIACANEGDVSAVHFLYVRYADEVLGYVESIVRDRNEAEDITQSVFAKLISAIRRYEQREGAFAAWIQRVARDAALERLGGRGDIAFEQSARATRDTSRLASSARGR